MTLNRYSPTHRQWDHVGNLVPNFEHSEGQRPAFYGIPAPWLPVLWEDKHFEVWVTVSAGKAVALTTDGYVVPAGLKVDWTAAAGGDTILTYAVDDVDEKTIDLTTGDVVTGAVSYTKTQVQTAIRERGLVDSGEAPEDYVSRAIGVAAQSYYSWASSAKDGFNPADLKFHNFRMQHQVQVLCDYVLRLPWLASAEDTVVLPGGLTSGTPVFEDANMYSAANTKLLTRYEDLTGTNFVAYFGADKPIAVSTDRTPITADDAGLLVRKRSGPDALTASGDYYIDYDVGVWFFYESGGDAAPAVATGTTLTFNHYESVPTSVHDYVAVTGDLRPGDFVEVDADSNFTRSTSSDPRVIMGQVLGFIKHPKDFLDRVKTQYTGLGTVNQMPGTATDGFPDTLNVSTTGADTEVIINLITR